MKGVKCSKLTQIGISVILGIGFGLLFPRLSSEMKVVGDVFLRLMQMAIPLLILGQIIQAVAGINPKELTSVGAKTLVTFGVSSLLAAVWGIVLSVIFKPGIGTNIKGLEGTIIKNQEISITKTIVEFFPRNIFESLTESSIIQIIVFALFFWSGFKLFYAKSSSFRNLSINCGF